METIGYKDGIVRYPVSVIDHNKQSEDPVQQDVDVLKGWKEQQETAVPDNVIEGIKETENFLANTSDAETLAQMLSALTNSITTALSSKADIENVYDKEAVDEADRFLQTFAMLMPVLAQTDYSTISVVSNPEFKVVLTDSENRIIAGIRVDNSYVGLPTNEAIDAILEAIENTNISS